MALVSRIRSIDLRLGIRKSLLSPLSQPAPLLESITLDGLHDDGRLSLPGDALSDAPLLRNIDLQCLDVSWNSAIFKHQNLTSLSLDECRGTSAIGQMFDALDHMPNLRVLVLAESIPSHTTGGRNEKCLEFKHLERLELLSPALDCIFFLRHIHYPTDVIVKLDCFPTRSKDCTTILSLIGQSLQHTQSVKAETCPPPVTIRSARMELFLIDVPEISFSAKADCA